MAAASLYALLTEDHDRATVMSMPSSKAIPQLTMKEKHPSHHDDQMLYNLRENRVSPLLCSDKTIYLTSSSHPMMEDGNAALPQVYTEPVRKLSSSI